MDSSEQRRKRKRSLSILLHINKLSSASAKSLFLLTLFTLLFVLFHHNKIVITPYSLKLVPISASSSLSLLSSSYSINSADTYSIEGQVSFPDHILLLVSSKAGNGLMIGKNDGLECVYGTGLFNESDSNKIDSVTSNVLSVDEYRDGRFIVRCPLSQMNYTKVVDLVWLGRSLSYYDGDDNLWGRNWTVNSWKKVVYEVALDGETVVVFAKGLNLKSNRESNPTPFSCHFSFGTGERDERFVLTTKAVTAAQEVVRCLLPQSIRSSPEKAQGIGVTIGVTHDVHARAKGYTLMPSVAKISNSKVMGGENKKKYELCACTMVWNQASVIREWISYHAWLGVERWFIYDNNSDDGIKDATEELDREGYNVSRHVWPWIKTQEAGFSHCALRAKDECNWVSFMDVDEFFYFPIPTHQRRKYGNLVSSGQNSLRHMVSNFSSSASIAEIRTTCLSFGPSGLKSSPLQGVTAGYTCRLRSPERHKSIVRPEALDDTLLTVIHHFHLKKGYTYMNLPPSIAVIDHYKYQVWETFKAKFFRRVATYVADWKDNKNEGSRDRAPGLGTEAIEPPDWHLRFCEVWDTGLRDFVLANMADPGNGLLPWQRS